MKLKFYIFLWFSLLTKVLFGQEAELVATVSKSKLGVNQRLRIEFSINKQGADNFKAPNFNDFKVVGGPSQSVSQSWINGKVTFNKTYSYIIQPKHKGVLTLNPASIEISGEVIQSKPIKITVTEAVEVPKNPNDPDYIAQQNIHLVAHISNTNPYVGEAISVEYRIYVKDVEASLANRPEKTKFEGFWNQQIDVQSLDVQKGQYKGEQYSYAVLQKSLLIPTKSGKLYIEPLNVDLYIAVPTRQIDFWGNRLTQRVQKSFSSARRLINVKQLPLQNKPDGFAGAVGDYQFDVALSKSTLKANESSQIRVKVSGKGNIKLFELPKLEMPVELEVYQPERKERVSVTSSGIKGSITNTYTVVPQYKGKYKILGSKFSYFNPKDKQYHTITANDLFVDVLEGKELPKVSQTSQENEVLKKAIKTTGNSFHFIQTKSSFSAIKQTDFFGSFLFYTLLFFPFLVVPIIVFIGKKQKEKLNDIAGNKLRRADKLARKYLLEAEKNLGKKEAFYESLERALHNYLKAKLNIETTEISREKITDILHSRDIDNITINSFIEVLKDCDFARYTPITDVQMQSEYQKAKQVIMELDKQL